MFLFYKKILDLMSEIKQVEKKSKSECIKIFKDKILENPNILESLKHLFSNFENEEIFLRPLIWKIYLETLKIKEENNIKEIIINFIEEISNQREEYKKKFKKYCKIKKFSNDPLGGKTIEKKNKEEIEDEELKHLINLDLSRTYQNLNLFLESKTKNLLADVLFIWSKENNDINYKQGMNELLSVFYLCFYPYYFITRTKPKPNKNNIISFINNNLINENLEDIYIFFYDEDEIKSDLFFIFDSLMKKGMKYLFIQDKINNNDPILKSYEIFPNELIESKDNNTKETYIKRRSSLIINEKLRILDNKLYEHFQKIDLDCSFFLQRWLRCIFNREFDYKEVLILWDSIFSYEYTNKNTQKYNLIYIEFISLAMIIRIRDDLKYSDQNECFSTLFKYPKINNIKDLIKLSDKVAEVINERINGQNSNVYDILGIMKPIESRPFKITPHEYNQRKGSIDNKKSENNNTEFSKNAKTLLSNALNSLGKFGGIVKDISIKVSEKIDKINENYFNEPSNNTNINGVKILENNNNNKNNNNNNKNNNDNKNNNNNKNNNGNNKKAAKENSNKQLKEIKENEGNVIKEEKKIEEDNKVQNNVPDSKNTEYNREQNDDQISYNKNDILDIINKLDELDGRYNTLMNNKDQKDMKTIISYLKNNAL